MSVQMRPRGSVEELERMYGVVEEIHGALQWRFPRVAARALSLRESIRREIQIVKIEVEMEQIAVSRRRTKPTFRVIEGGQ